MTTLTTPRREPAAQARHVRLTGTTGSTFTGDVVVPQLAVL